MFTNFTASDFLGLFIFYILYEIVLLGIFRGLKVFKRL
jgi:hypothetical protein